MRSKFSPRARLVALALCAGALGSFSMAAPAMAAAPAGSACQASDGKISGRGSTLQGSLIALYITGYTNDVCGAVAAQTTNLNPGITTDPAGSNMLVYNWGSSTTALSPTAAGARGSGEGLAAMGCRTEAFGGTDIPYANGTGPTNGVLPFLWEDLPSSAAPFTTTFNTFADPAFGPDGLNGCDSFYNKNGTAVTAWLPPYSPAPNASCAATGTQACYPSTAPLPGTTTAVTNSVSTMMSFPVGIGAAALGVNFNLDEPAITLGANTGTGGTARFWKLTAINASGQTLGSNEITAAVGGATPETQVINWTAVPGATGYDLYGAAAAGGEGTSPALVATVTAATACTGTACTITDTGTATTAGSVPTTNTANVPGCPTTAGGSTQVQLTPTQISMIFEGNTALSNWSQLGNETSFNWTGCNEPITRVVRGDISGTTQEMKTYLRSIDPTRLLCDGASTWTTLSAYATNTNWPGDSTHSCTGVAAPTTALGTGGGSGCPGFTATFDTTKGVVCGASRITGSITYGDLGNWSGTPNVMYAEVVPVSGTTGVLPGTSATLGAGNPNCDTSFAPNTPGSASPSDFVGLNGSAGVPTTQNWGTDGANGPSGTPPSNITNIAGSLKYPICTLTYDMVYTGLSGAQGSGPIGGLTNDQRRTLYTFWRYVLSPDGQGQLGTALTPKGWLPIPASWASKERAGFIAGF